MPTIGELYSSSLADCKKYDLLSSDVRILLAHDEGLAEQIDVIYSRDKEMAHPVLFAEQMKRLKNGEPVEYIINEASFLQHKLYVDNRVLIPRSETEELVANITEKISDYFDPRNYLVCADIGTGSGAIAIALKSAFPHWVMMASDISKGALEVAKKNFTSTATQCQLVEGDALAPYIEGKTHLDILVSNPPYILNKEDAQVSVRDYEPSSALWLDKSKSVYESIFRDCYKVKKGALFMAFEISPDLVEWLTSLMEKYLHNYTYEFTDDLNKNKRFLFVLLKEDNNA
jgi:release factor glutamine methyltransferase